MKNYDRKLWGLVLIGIASYFVAGEFGLLVHLDFLERYDFWPAILAVPCFIWLVAGVKKKSIMQIVFSAVFTFYFMQEWIGLTDISMWMAVLISLLLGNGLALIFPNYKFDSTTDNYRSSTEYNKYSNADGANTAGTNTARTNPAGANGNPNVSVLFGSAEKFVYSQDYKSSSISCTFGEAKVYFDEARMAEESATLSVSVQFAEVTIFLPSNWHVESTVSNIFAETTIHGKRNVTDKTLYLRGNVTFAELTIIYI